MKPGSGCRAAAAQRRAGFRLLTEPASLKPPPAAHRAWTPSGSFRLLTEPASLKRERPCLLPRRRARFRLLTEPASLKLLVADHCDPATPGFRLLTEPASLKHIHDNLPVLRSLDTFPAPHGAGLIEAVSISPSRPPASGFPAPHGAGLIEAGRPADSGRVGSWFPAPHGAGLIEAWSGHMPTRRRSRRFRLLTEPASLKPLDVAELGVDEVPVSGSSRSRPH